MNALRFFSIFFLMGQLAFAANHSVQQDTAEVNYQKGLKHHHLGSLKGAAHFYNLAAQNGHAKAALQLGLMILTYCPEQAAWGIRCLEEAKRLGAEEAEFHLSCALFPETFPDFFSAPFP